MIEHRNHPTTHVEITKFQQIRLSMSKPLLIMPEMHPELVDSSTYPPKGAIRTPFPRRTPITRDWMFALDPENAGKELGWDSKVPNSHSLVSAGRPLEYWHPGYDGAAWYWKELSLESSTGGHVHKLSFEGVSYWCECWVNGSFAGAHEGAYDAFSFDVTPYLIRGANLVAIRIINPPENWEVDGLRSGSPLCQSDLPIGKAAWYYNFGGIWGRVWHEVLPAVAFEDLWVDADWVTKDLTVKWTVNNVATTEESTISIVVRERESGRAVLEASRTLMATPGTQEGKLHLSCEGFTDWSPEDPFLYVLEAQLSSPHGDCVISRQFGVRDFRIEGRRFILNGRATFLKGLLQQGAYPRRLAGADTWLMAARELLTVKRAGFNFVRIHLKPAEDWYQDLADRLGILLMLELPIGWIANGPHTERRILREVKTLLSANRSRACVVMWGLFNESFHLVGFEPAQFRQIAERMMQEARKVDDSRLLFDTSGGYTDDVFAGAETMIHDTFRHGTSRYLQPRSCEMNEIVDAHVYCSMPPTVAMVSQYREMDPGNAPLFVSEFGAAETPPDFEKVLATYSPRDRNTGLEDWQLHLDFHHSLTKRFAQAGLGAEFENVGAWIEAVNRERASEVRVISLAAMSNPHVAGLCYCQLADASGELFGVLDFWRRPKPLLAALSAGLETPACGFFPAKYWISTGETLPVTITMATDGKTISEGQATVSLAAPVTNQTIVWSGSIKGATGRACEREFTVQPQTEGIHELHGSITLRDGSVVTTSSTFGVLTETTCRDIKASCRLASSELLDIVASCGIEVEPYGNNYRNKDAVVLLEWASIADKVNSHGELLGQIRNLVQAGGSAIIFDPETPMLYETLLPVFISVQPVMRTSTYLKKSPVFAGLPSGIVAGCLYADILPDRWDNADQVLASGGHVDVGAFSMHMWTRPAEYFWGAGLYRIPVGRGQVFISHLKLLNQIDTNPLARRVFQNIVQHAASLIQPGGHEHMLRRCIDR